MSATEDLRIVVSRTLGRLTYSPSRRAVLPQRIEATVSSKLWGLEVTLVIVIEDDRGVVDEVRLRRNPLGKSISAESLRSLPVARIVRHAIEIAAIPASVDHGRMTIEVIGAEGTPLSAEVAETVIPHSRARMTNDQRQERLAEVAAAYRTGVSDPSVTNPSSYVAKTLAISGSYARKLIYDARAVGLLRPAPGRGRAGEISTNGQKKP
jgi:hypothetical protein